jgi:hypothetical protein
MARSLENQILSFGELQEPHTSLTIAYSSVRVETGKLYNGMEPIDPIRHLIIILQENARDMGGDGLKNIQIKMVPLTQPDGTQIIDYYAMATIIN